ncbi:MAG TPA: tetratricopeptide repeat protein, partial [Longimicrobiales bacterium]
YAPVVVDAARFRGRVARRGGDWAGAIHWYGVARRVAEVIDDAVREALVLDGLGHVHVSRGNFPEAQAVLTRALAAAQGGADPDVRGSIHFTLMTLAHTAGDLAEAARQGWRSFMTFEEEIQRLRALTALGGVFLEGRALDAAEDAFSVVRAGTEELYYRLYALEGLAHAAALRGNRQEYERRLVLLHDAGFDRGTPDFKAEAYLERGDAYLHLRDESLAREWYEKAVDYAQCHGINEYLMRAEKALQSLDEAQAEEGDGVGSVARPSSTLQLSEPEIKGIREDLREARQALARSSP